MNRILNLLKTKEVLNMRKTLFTVCLVFLSVVMMYNFADAVGGQCSNCHTMHNSQNGAAMSQDYLGADLAPQAQLLRSDCIGCHSTATGQTSTFGGPAVLHTTAPAGQGAAGVTKYTLAGGDFYWVNAGTATMGHNVIDLPGISGKDANFANFDPPGWDPVATGSSFAFGQVAGGTANWASQLTCAGKFGCHGDHAIDGNFAGVQGAHHGNAVGTGSDGGGTPTVTGTSASSPATVGASFRFLGGIEGLEDENWNWNENTTTQHNEYSGENNIAARASSLLASYGGRDTMSFLCAECHGQFHGTIKSASVWVRHPTDILLPASGEYATYNNDGGPGAGSYSLEAPIARAVVPAAASNTVTPGTDIVMCLSCHRAHGSNQPDLLRWSYTSMVAGGGATTGCFVCHTGKN